MTFSYEKLGVSPIMCIGVLESAHFCIIGEDVEEKQISNNGINQKGYSFTKNQSGEVVLQDENKEVVLSQFLIWVTGIDFAFLGRQKRITVDNRDYYIDLLFYHRRMRRLVVIELKLEEFKPEHKGQAELYLRWLNKYERMEGEESPLALILCAEKSSETIELLELDNSGIHVAQYLTQSLLRKYSRKNCIKQYKEPDYNWNKEAKVPISSLAIGSINKSHRSRQPLKNRNQTLA